MLPGYLVCVPLLVQGRLALDWQVVPLLSLPIALGFGIAVVFYQLFDIRIVIQRTLVWGALTALIVRIFATWFMNCARPRSTISVYAPPWRKSE